MPRTLHTLGHSTRSPGEWDALLRAAGLVAGGCVADVRRFPHSRRHPHFDVAALGASLAGQGVAYRGLGPSLGGRVPETVGAEASPNRAWTEAAFRRYADWMATDAFRAGLAELETLAAERPTALLCAERPWWRCHRRLLADALTIRGWIVLHWMEPEAAPSRHELPGWARVDGERLTYPGLL